MTDNLSGKTINTIRALRCAGWKVHRIANFFGLEPWKVAKITRRVTPLKYQSGYNGLQERGFGFEVVPVDRLLR